MAKSGKSNKSADKAEKSVETENAEDSVTAKAEESNQSAKDGVSEDTPVADDGSDTTPDQQDDGIVEAAETVEAEETSDTPVLEEPSDGEADAASEETSEGAHGNDSLMSEAENEADVDAASSDAETPWGERLEEKTDDTQASQNTESDVAPLPVVTPAAAPQRGSMWPAVFGGVIAALVGFIAGRGDQLDQYLPESMQRQSADLSVLEKQTASLSETNDALSEQISDLSARIESLEGAEAADFTDDVSNLEASMAVLADRLNAVENRPIVEAQPDGASNADVAALQNALDAQRAEIAALAALAEEAEANAASEASRILARAALTRVMTAVDSGETFTPALDDLENVTPVAVPDPLRTAAESGVPRFAELQSSFPQAARAGLAAARSDVPESDVQGITGFLKRQLRARSIQPREGDDPDAVLSRAEAAMRAGDLDAALTEMDALPEVARAAMDEWLQAASARQAAQNAANDLADSLNSN